MSEEDKGSQMLISLCYSDIVAQTLASLIFLCWAYTHVAGAFQPIRADIAVSDYSTIYYSWKPIFIQLYGEYRRK